ncbi:hypothetical protein B0T24DRAFT_723929 [Lasiosphaeria ovina]|uniref:Uncharacterized protein n=1 Tax=Lasiosphaeria ovina TaxID=92902 RepID=A0AAE0JWB9_9PEZI|nr:hypothetical protein B0T24DRAFT_723929 [Lasiosphaeria ovina]
MSPPFGVGPGGSRSYPRRRPWSKFITAAANLILAFRSKARDLLIWEHIDTTLRRSPRCQRPRGLQSLSSPNTRTHLSSMLSVEISSGVGRPRATCADRWFLCGADAGPAVAGCCPSGYGCGPLAPSPRASALCFFLLRDTQDNRGRAPLHVAYFTLDAITKIAYGKEFGYLAADKDIYDYIKTCEEQVPSLVVMAELPFLASRSGIPGRSAFAGPTPEAVALLQRPESLGLREYLTHLTELGVLAPLPLNGDFLMRGSGPRMQWVPIPSHSPGLGTGANANVIDQCHVRRARKIRLVSAFLGSESWDRPRCRNILGGVFPLVTGARFRNLGEARAGGLLGAIATALTAVPWVLVFFGERIRARSPFACADQMEQLMKIPLGMMMLKRGAAAVLRNMGITAPEAQPATKTQPFGSGMVPDDDDSCSDPDVMDIDDI